jgi:Peptidase family M28/PKD domain
MRRSISRPWPAVLIVCSGLMLAAIAPAASAAPQDARHGQPGRTAASPAPGIDPAFIYSQLAYLVTHFQHREAGYRAGSAGHTGFARYWAGQMLRLLGPFGAGERIFRFPLRGWLGRPATAPAADVEITVPGLAKPAQEVVIGCHYDGEADSTESAYDDGSGCAIELGVAQAMAAFWRAHHLYPARTLRFVIFDAEEQGLFGSYEYVNAIARDDLPDITAMINEEQNGIAYPLRYLGKSSNPLMPLYAFLSPLAGNNVYPRYSLTARQLAALRQFRTLVKQAVPASFGRFRAMGDQMLTYHESSGSDVWRPVFTPAQHDQVRVLGDTLGSSDQVPFTQAGVRSATFVGNATYYRRHPQPGSYPYDQPQDTIALMNVFADGGSAASHALQLALGLPGLLTTWLLSRPAVLGSAAPDGRPVAAIGDCGVILPGRRTAFTADASFLPDRPGARLTYAWDFGDGHLATGRIVHHTYLAPGDYTLRLLVRAGHGRPRVISKRLLVGPQAGIANPYARAPAGAASPVAIAVAKGLPPPNPAARLPAPVPGARDRVGTVAQARRPADAPRQARRSAARHAGSAVLAWIPALLGAAVLLLVVSLARLRVRRRRMARETSRP